MNNIEYYQNNLNKSVEQKNAYIKGKAEWFRNLVFIASTIFGILVAFYNKSNFASSHLYILAIVSLVLCILSGILVSYQELFYQNKTQKRFVENIKTALANNQNIEPVFVGKGLLFLLFEIVCIVSFSLSVILFLLQILIASQIN